MKTVIAANGVLEPNARLVTLWRDADLRVAANGGAINARQHLQLAPHIVIGDLDSLDDETARWLNAARTEKIQHPCDKDQTDLELAIELAQARGTDEIVILAALGGRPDQMLANVLLLTRFPGMKIADAQSEMWVVQNETEIVGEISDTVSLIPLSASVEGITTRGLAYPLNGESLALGSTRGISNELIERRAIVQVESGMLLVIHLFSNHQ